ncbi:MAG: GGDEF domain-containing protein [Bacillota bacterium]
MKNIIGKFKYIIIVLLSIMMIYIFSTQFTNIVRVIEDKYKSQRLLVEKNITQTLSYVNDAYKIAEKQLNKEMKDYSEQMVQKYKENPNIISWELDKLKKQFNGFDIYIIDKNLKIIKTTYKEDLGLDFSKFGSFSKVLRKRMNSDTFEVDRLDVSTQAGEIKKYSYMPSPDNKYLFELSVSIEQQYPSFDSLNIFKDATELTKKYDVVEDISFYSVEPINYKVAKLRNSKKPYLNPDVPLFEEKLAKQAVINDKIQNKTKIIDNIKYNYRFFPVLRSNRDKENGWNFYVVGITYNTQYMQDEIAQNRQIFIINILFLGLLFALFISIVVYLLKRFEYQAHHDSLTKLSNRKHFAIKFNNLKGKMSNNNQKSGIIFIDVDHFKEINDNYGHEVGDEVLKNIAYRIENNLKSKDLKARMGGDEFLIALTDLSAQDEIISITKRLIDDIQLPLTTNSYNIDISISAGLSIFPDDGKDLDILIKKADSAMYKAKKENNSLVICE